MSTEAHAAYARPSADLAIGPRLLGELWSTRDRSRWPESPPGHGRPAMLVPGFLASDPSLSRMALWLRAGGWQTVRPGIRFNVDCMEPAVEALEQRLERSVDRSGRRALVLGQSRGGSFGR